MRKGKAKDQSRQRDRGKHLLRVGGKEGASGQPGTDGRHDRGKEGGRARPTEGGNEKPRETAAEKARKEKRKPSSGDRKEEIRMSTGGMRRRRSKDTREKEKLGVAEKSKADVIK